MKSIWLPGREEFDSNGVLKEDIKIVGRNEAVIINPHGLSEIVKELKDYRNFVLTHGYENEWNRIKMNYEKELGKGYYSEKQVNKLIIWKEVSTYHGREDEEEFILVNPYPNMLDLIIGNEKENFNMKNLVGSCINMNLEYFLEVLEGAEKTGVDVRPILMATMPEITKFSSEILDCIEFVEVETRNIIEFRKQLNELEEKCYRCRKKQRREELQGLYHTMYHEFSSMSEAKTNHRVLSLVKRIEKII